MALLDLFFTAPKPRWMLRQYGRPYVEICVSVADMLIEGLYQGRLALLGTEPPTDTRALHAADRGVVDGVLESTISYMVRLRRWLWSARAAGIAGIAHAVLITSTPFFGWAGAVPYSVSGESTELGIQIEILVGGTVGIVGISYRYSLDNGSTWSPPIGLGTNLSITVGSLTLTWRSGDTFNALDILQVLHGGRGLMLSDLDMVRINGALVPAPQGKESLLEELAAVLSPNTPRMKLVTADGTWWTRETDGTTWRLMGGPWAWEASKDADPSYWARGLIIIDAPSYIQPWELLGLSMHYLGEPGASYGTTATVEWWTRLLQTVDRYKPADMRVEAVILNFDSSKFDPGVPSTCSEDTWYRTGKYDVNGAVRPSRPVEYAWFSGPR